MQHSLYALPLYNIAHRPSFIITDARVLAQYSWHDAQKPSLPMIVLLRVSSYITGFLREAVSTLGCDISFSYSIVSRALIDGA